MSTAEQSFGWVSVAAVAWALDHAPDVPPALLSTLIAVARYADATGRNAHPSIKTVARATRKSDRQVKRDVAELRKLGLLLPGDPAAVAHLHPEQRPAVYDIPIHLRAPAPGDTHDTGVTDDTRVTGDPLPVSPTSPGGCHTGSDPVSPTSPKEPLKNPEKNPVSNPSPLPPGDPPAPAQRQPRTEKVGVDFEEDGQADHPLDERPDSHAFDTDALVAEIRTLRPEWGRSGIAKAIAAALADGRPEHLIRPAALAVARDPETRVPGRLNHDGEWWHRAADPFAAKPHCGRCDSDTRLIWGDDNTVTNCPRCWTPRDPEHARRAHANRIHDMPPCEHGRSGGHVPCPATGWVACDFERRRIGWVAMDETPRRQGGGYRAFGSSDLQDFNANFDTHRTYRMSTTDARVAQALALGDQYPDDEQTPQITNGAPW